jgi:phosphoribosylformylglycinamidine cyclo-ligase
MTSSKYEELGVSATKSGLHRALSAAGRESSSRFFAAFNSDLAGSADYVTVLHSDGAGTKSIVAYLLYRETGNARVFRGLAQDALVMNLDDIFCVGIPTKLLLTNQLARNAMLIGDDAVAAVIAGYTALVDQLRSLGIDIELAGGETADCPDVVRTLLVDAVVCARIPRAGLVDTTAISEGDVIVGVSSTGQAAYESQPNSGIGSNGLTLARHALLSRYHAQKYPEVLSPEIDAEAAYRGPYKVTDCVDSLGMPVGEALLSPTRTYAPFLVALSRELGPALHGVIHNTGGGQTKVVRFGERKLYRKHSLFEIPPIFELIQRHGAVSWREMYQAFNMGHRLEVYMRPQDVERAVSVARTYALDARAVGEVQRHAGRGNAVRLDTAHGSFTYKVE